MKKSIWTEEKIQIGFTRFFTEYGRLPRAHEIDTLPYLPSSRFIQKKFNGLEKLRTQLGFSDTHFGKGAHRSIIAHQVNTNGRAYERTLETLLYRHFGEVFVHSEKMLSTSKVRVDFYVYCPDGNFAIDIFYANTMRTLQSNVNIKANKYAEHHMKMFLVSANDNISQNRLDSFVKAKVNPLPPTIQLMSYSNFVTEIQDMKAYSNPVT